MCKTCGTKPRQVTEFTKDAIDVHLGNALAKLMERDAILFALDANERSLAFRLALYLVCEFPDFHVDCEYNRYYRSPDHHKRLYEGKLRKYVKRKTPFTDGDGLTVFPDIIVHRRETPDNLLIIELKKTTSTAKDGNAFDQAKLSAYRQEIGYRFARFIRLETGAERPSIAENSSL